MEHSESVNELAAALAKAQGQIDNAIKDSANPFFKSKYADLAGIRDMIRKPLSDNGIAVVQGVGYDFGAGLVHVVTSLIHSSGQWIRSTLFMPIKGEATPQAVGSAATYGRRYGLSGMVGIAQEDDDAELAMGRKPSVPNQLLNQSQAWKAHAATTQKP